MREIVVFSGSAHTDLAEKICADLGVELSPVEIHRFSNDCLQAQLQANCRQRDVYIVQPLVPPTQEHLMELLMMIDAFIGERWRRLYGEALAGDYRFLSFGDAMLLDRRAS